jgi:peptide/nickel transport system substrate-binding protein
MLVACTGLPPATLGSSALQERTQAASASLDRLVWDLPSGEPTTLDYQQAGDQSPYFVISQMCDSLLRLNPDESESPALASSWTRPDPLTVVLHLRGDVRFWDGTLLSASDVVYSLNRQLDPSAVANSFFVNVTSIQATDPHTVTVHFARPDELFVKELATTAGTVVEAAYARREGKKFGTATGGVMCSGPYELKAWNSGQSIELTANPHYWDPAYRPHADKVSLEFVTDTTALTQALSSGAIDGAYEVPNSTLPTLKNSNRGRLYYGPSLEMLQLMPLQATGPAADPDIRRALSLVVDRQELAATVYRGAATPATTLLPTTSWDPQASGVYRAAATALPVTDLKPTAADLAEAKTLVAKHRAELRPTVIAVQAGLQDDLDAATVIQQAAATLGLTMTVRQLPPLQFSSMFYDPTYRKGLDWTVGGAFLDIPDPLDWVPNVVMTNGIFNWSGAGDSAIDADLTQAQQTFDPHARAMLITDAQRRWEAKSPSVPLLTLDEVTYMNSRITGATTSFAYLFTPSLALVGSR